MNELELISVIVPCYNIEKYVERCINSILKQTYRNIEVIAVDDGSKDRTGKILNELKKTDERLKVYHFPNGGPSLCRNRALDVAEGEYIMCVDGDDFIDQDMIREMYKKIHMYDSDIVACNYYMYYGNGKKIIENEISETIFQMSREMAMEMVLMKKTRFVSAWGKLYRKSLWTRLRYPIEVRFGEDMYMIHQLIEKCNHITYLYTPFYYYNQEGVSLVRSDFNLSKLRMLDADKMWISLCEKKYPRLVVKAKGLWISTMINMCTFLCEKEELHIYYIEIKKEIVKYIKDLKKFKLSRNDKIKAYLIAYSSPHTYKIIRNMFVKV